MNITKQRLKQIIKEEMARIVNEESVISTEKLKDMKADAEASGGVTLPEEVKKYIQALELAAGV